VTVPIIEAAGGALHPHGLPAPEHAWPLTRPSRYPGWRLVFADGAEPAELWMRRTPTSARRSAVAALHGAAGASLAVPQVLFLDTPYLPGPMVVHAPIRGVDGVTTLLRNPERREEVHACIGRFARALSRIEVPTWGLHSVDGRRFAPCAASWRDAWWERARSAAARASLLGPLAAEALSAIEQRLPSLMPERFTLVHGDLIPAAFILGEEDEVLHTAGVLDWGMACWGDPVLELTALLRERDPAARRSALRAAQHTESELLRVLPQLEAYDLTRALQLAAPLGPPVPHDGRSEAGRLARARMALEETLAGGMTARIRAAFHGGALDPDPSPVALRVQRALGMFRRWPVPLAAAAPALLGALAATRLHHPSALEAADGMLDQLGLAWETLEPGPTRPAPVLAGRQPSLSLPLLALAQSAMAPGCSRVEQGLHHHLHALLLTERDAVADPASDLVLGLLGLAALQELPEAGHHQSALAATVRASLDRLELPPPSTPISDALAALKPQHQPLAWALAWALQCLDDSLPVDAAAVLALAGVR
jgi:aminoglycoside phosphotransferase (APT) family kinase protein